MPLSKDDMREYQRKRRGQEPKSSQPNGDDRTQAGKEVQFHEHYWQREGNTVRCVPYHFQRRDIGGCGEIRPYEGKLIPSFDDNDLVSSIAKLSAKAIDRWLAVPGPINTGKHPQRDAP